MTVEITIPVSPEQAEVIVDSLIEGTDVGLLPDERAWMLSHARKLHPGCKILGADLDIPTATWTLTLNSTETL